jgi:hypothetical protein
MTDKYLIAKDADGRDVGLILFSIDISANWHYTPQLQCPWACLHMPIHRSIYLENKKTEPQYEPINTSLINTPNVEGKHILAIHTDGNIHTYLYLTVAAVY